MPKTDIILSPKSLHYFLQLIDTMNYTQAAQILGITQPALSQQIKKIEHAIGTPLFGQNGKKLYLTEAGKQLQVGAIKLLGTVNSVVRDIQEFNQADKGTITVGILEGIDQDILQRFWIDFNKKNPQIITTFVSFNRKDLWYNLDNNLIDLAIIYIPCELKKSQANLHNQYESMTISQDSITILTHNDGMKAGKSYPISEFVKTNWVAYPDSFYLRQLMKEKFNSTISTKNQMKVPMSFSSTGQLIKIAEATNYDTFISYTYYQTHRNEIRLTPVHLLDDQKFLVSIVYRKGKKDIPRIKNILTELKKSIDD
ncbi:MULTISPECIES: LysR family transcriptional regulator [unclassified Lactobacillus]|uniref:LysR family transcriptional regulator n=1 Tax=unclassified Lactobacillus TaxID=2620435 RepID=UPI000EFB2BE5|nr:MULTISPECIES: LysR family transcriptional regulator [unclassified Lactobacillus]RMC24616.1 LysR family transcriptional regulator [Lactobacillus sp. ESL0247]RMC28888.1 LysR family transcriptional regulator [Lactobacillus sp. ESL0246]RMC32133.1 LysR family transcriptional regulator [Lactobacillus sp. ESL0245]